jgi:myo-inositol-1(or 4)-monophosphatase
MTPFVRVFAKASQRGAALFSAGWRNEYAYADTRGAGGDMSMGIDRLAESIYIEELADFGAIDSEESGLIGEGKPTIVLDPIDGSDNAVSGLPFFGAAAARKEGNTTVEAAVANLATGELFFKSGNDAAHHAPLSNLKSARPVVPRETPKVAIVEKAYAYPEMVAALRQQGIKFRSPGAVAISLAIAPWVDFVIFPGPRRRYDFDAPLFLCEGLGIVTNPELLIVSANPARAETIYDIIKDTL